MPISDELVCALNADTIILQMTTNRCAIIQEYVEPMQEMVRISHEKAISQIKEFAKRSRSNLICVHEDWSNMHGSRNKCDDCCIKFVYAKIELQLSARIEQLLHTSDFVSEICNAINNNDKDLAKNLLLDNDSPERFAAYLNRPGVHIVSYVDRVHTVSYVDRKVRDHVATKPQECSARELLLNILKYVLSDKQDEHNEFPNQLRYDGDMWSMELQL